MAGRKTRRKKSFSGVFFSGQSRQLLLRTTTLLFNVVQRLAPRLPDKSRLQSTISPIHQEQDETCSQKGNQLLTESRSPKSCHHCTYNSSANRHTDTLQRDSCASALPRNPHTFAPLYQSTRLFDRHYCYTHSEPKPHRPCIGNTPKTPTLRREENNTALKKRKRAAPGIGHRVHTPTEAHTHPTPADTRQLVSEPEGFSSRTRIPPSFPFSLYHHNFTHNTTTKNARVDRATPGRPTECRVGLQFWLSAAKKIG